MRALRDFNANVFTFSYDALGRRTNLTRPNLVNTSYTYDALSRLLSVVHQQGLIGAGTRYAYDAVGNRTARTDFSLGAGQVVQSYTYDSIYQLTQAVVSTVPPTTTETYSYDQVGNRLSSLGAAPYSYDSSNELTSKPGVTYTYDANGNTLTKTAPNGMTTYTWDFENRLTSVATSKGKMASFKYDPFGRRIFKDSPTKTTIFAYDGDNIVEDLDLTGKPVARYTQGLGIDEPLATTASGVMSFYHADGLGSITSLSDPTGAVANSYTYDSFGNVTASTGTVSNRFFFTARENVAKAGLLYYRARYYDPSVGRLLNEDPIRFQAGTDFYTYVHNNPINLIDPAGLCEVSPKMKGCLEKLFKKSVSNVKIVPGGKFHLPNVRAETRVNKIIIYVPCDDFLLDDRVVLEEYFHVLEQWDAGRLTRIGYLWESLKHGYENNRFEIEAQKFASDHLEEFEKCLNCKR